MGNSSKKHAKLEETGEGAAASASNGPTQISQAVTKFEGNNAETTDEETSDKPGKKIKKEKVKKEKIKKDKKNKEKKDKEKKETRDKEKKEKKQEKKEKKEKEKKEKKEKGKKKEGKTTPKKEDIADPIQTITSNGSGVDITNFSGDSNTNVSTITVTVDIVEEPRKKDEMRGRENMRPVTVYEGRSPRPASPTGPGVSALMEKFGGKAKGTPRPISYPASRVMNETPKSELHEAVNRKTYGFQRAEETPRKPPRGEITESNVHALRQKFGGNNAGSPESTKPVSSKSATPAAYATPTTYGNKQLNGVTKSATPTTSTTTTTTYGNKVMNGAANRWQNKQTERNTDVSTPKRKNDIVTSTTTTPTATTTKTLANRFGNKTNDKTEPTGVIPTNPEKKRKIGDDKTKETEITRREETVQKENEKNKSPRKRWSPKKEPKTSNRDNSPTKETSPRKRKSSVLDKFGSLTKGRTRSEGKDDVKEEAKVVRRTNLEKKTDQDDKEKARQLILNRTSALLQNTTATPKSSPRVKFEETTPTPTPRRVKQDNTPKQRPKTEYNFHRTPSPRPKSMGDVTPSKVLSTPGGTNIIKNPTTKTQKLLQWCQIHTQGYDGVNVSNFSSSWADGLAFCALVHKFHPHAIDFTSLDSNNRRHNFDLAFSSAQKYANVPLLLETDDMLFMGDKPDWKCVFTYITALYQGLTR